MTANGLKVVRWSTPGEAIEVADAGSAVMVLAETYPFKTTGIGTVDFVAAAAKGLRMYVEFPSNLPGYAETEKRKLGVERCVITSEVFGPSLPPMRILCVHDCHFVTMPPDMKPHIVAARVAGYDTAVYGIADAEQFPILSQFADASVLVSATKLSQFVTARYAPQGAFKQIWRFILGFLRPDLNICLDWEPAVHASYRSSQRLSPDAQRVAVVRGVDWHFKARMLLHPAWKSQYVKHREGRQNTEFGTMAAMPEQGLPVGDGREGLLEGIGSVIDWQGNQPACWWLRSDCNGESALAFALHALLSGNDRSKTIARNLIDWVYLNNEIFENVPLKASFGLLNWSPDNNVDNYQDNDVKAMLGCMGTAALLKTNRWDERLLTNILANFRTTGRHGFRGQKQIKTTLDAQGWQSRFHADTIHLAPHFEAWTWAAYLWLYHKTAFSPLLERTERGIRLMMEAYPYRWYWTNGIQQERGRMLLTLAWLLRVQDTPEHRSWLRRLFDDITLSQQASGAIAEEMGPAHNGRCHAPAANAMYGLYEAPLIQRNGDPCADMLYTCNFTLLGLHEAYAVTGEKCYLEAEDNLAQFLVRVQVKSASHPELDGAWFRAFDFDKWEYWGSNADGAWGAWCVECGWTQGWIITTLALRELGFNLWDLTKNSSINSCFENVRKAMLPG